MHSKHAIKALEVVKTYTKSNSQTDGYRVNNYLVTGGKGSRDNGGMLVWDLR